MTKASTKETFHGVSAMSFGMIIVSTPKADSLLKRVRKEGGVVGSNSRGKSREITLSQGADVGDDIVMGEVVPARAGFFDNFGEGSDSKWL
ncbi:hypothetical protein COCNU_11G009280 [Cocos nucifera]|uniref:Uncharacterized protein n=1 Tax=Cocos nucifera TaxID=13894 RepID=A0A8K0N954_COCNU|nr:hypothetical protein COCNU_11G009280 [Cocos nucifera]